MAGIRKSLTSSKKGRGYQGSSTVIQVNPTLMAGYYGEDISLQRGHLNHEQNQYIFTILSLYAFLT